MKGISLAIETIIFIILAVTVLTILLLFFTGTAGPSQREIQLRREVITLCGQYVQQDSACANPSIVKSDVTGALATKCKSLNTLKCTGTADSDCIKSCCPIVCPPLPKTTGQSSGP